MMNRGSDGGGSGSGSGGRGGARGARRKGDSPLSNHHHHHHHHHCHRRHHQYDSSHSPCHQHHIVSYLGGGVRGRCTRSLPPCRAAWRVTRRCAAAGFRRHRRIVGRTSVIRRLSWTQMSGWRKAIVETIAKREWSARLNGSTEQQVVQHSRVAQRYYAMLA